MPSQSTVVYDRHGRPRSAATLPSFRKGKPAPNRGMKLRAEVLTEMELEGLMSAISQVSNTGKRNRVMVWLMYAHQVKIGQLLSMQPWLHHEQGRATLLIPGSQGGKDRTRPLDSRAQQYLDDWWQARDELGVNPRAPLFCTISQPGRGQPVGSPYVRTMLKRMADRAGIRRPVTPEGLRATGKAHGLHETQGVAGRMESYILDAEFRRRYPEAFRHWKQAHDQLYSDPLRWATQIGHDCREALKLFSLALAERHEIATLAKPDQTIRRLRDVIGGFALGDRVDAFAEALVTYWGTTGDLAHRQEHGTSKLQPLVAEDSRRVVFASMVVMYEVDRFIERAASNSPWA